MVSRRAQALRAQAQEYFETNRAAHHGRGRRSAKSRRQYDLHGYPPGPGYLGDPSYNGMYAGPNVRESRRPYDDGRRVKLPNGRLVHPSLVNQFRNGRGLPYINSSRTSGEHRPPHGARGQSMIGPPRRPCRGSSWSPSPESEPPTRRPRRPRKPGSPRSSAHGV